MYYHRISTRGGDFSKISRNVSSSGTRGDDFFSSIFIEFRIPCNTSAVGYIVFEGAYTPIPRNFGVA